MQVAVELGLEGRSCSTWSRRGDLCSRWERQTEPRKQSTLVTLIEVGNSPPRVSSRMYASAGHHKERPQTIWLKQQTGIVSRSQKSKI